MHNSNLTDPLQRFSNQAVLFGPRPTRMALQSLQASSHSANVFQINVWRNHAFEPVEPLIAPFAHFGRWSPEFRLGGYDDSLSFSGHQPANAELVWIDLGRLASTTGTTEWLAERLATLRLLSKAPIVLATWHPDPDVVASLQRIADGLPATYFADLGAEAAASQVPLLDDRSSAVAGTRLSGACHLAIARKIACHWLAGAVLPPIKAVALDLDNTLHRGILGEDGIQGVSMTPAHSALQRFAAALSKRGVFVALVSRNEQEDVRALFERRTDYPLRWSDFSITEISWADKADAVLRVAGALRIGSDAVLFVDDNVGELASVSLSAPTVHTLHAHDDPAQTLRAIEFYPGLWRWKTEAEDSKRVQDLRANAERESLAKLITDPGEYFRSLQVALRFRIDPADQLGRLADLCMKTNQFNLALRRLTEAEVAQRMASSDACVASVQMRDRLSDSGVIAVIVAERVGAELVIEELCISCRAMGRNLESTVIVEAIRAMPVFSGVTRVSFRVQHGPRNQPALDWLAGFLRAPSSPSAGLHTVESRSLREHVTEAGVAIQVE